MPAHSIYSSSPNLVYNTAKTKLCIGGIYSYLYIYIYIYICAKLLYNKRIEIRVSKSYGFVVNNVLLYRATTVEQQR